MADPTPLPDLLERAGSIFALARRLANSFEDHRPAGTMNVDPSIWKQHHAELFQEFHDGLVELRDAILEPPAGFAAVAEQLREAVKIARWIRDTRASLPHRADYLDFYPHLATVTRPASSAKRRGQRETVLQNVWTESIDAARTIFLRSEQFETKKVLMVTSAVPGEGKTTLSSHLAISLSRAARKTLLIDLDLRRPSLHRVFDVPLGPGFCEVLRNECTLQEALHQTTSEGLFLLTTGQMCPLCLQLLASGGADPLFSELREQFDFVLIDSAPILPVTDSLLISHYTDGALFAVRRDVSQHAHVSAAYQRLSRIGATVFGAVAIGLHEIDHGYGMLRDAQYHRYLSESPARS